MAIQLEGFLAFDVFPGTASERAFWEGLQIGVWEPETQRAIRDLVHPGVVFWDIGAWIGPTALMALARGATVVAFEPDPVAKERLARNLGANPAFEAKTQLVNAALSRLDGQARLRAQDALGDSMSSLVGWGKPGPNVASMSFRRALDTYNLPAGSFVKIDIEGGEYGLGWNFWRELRRRGCSVLLSTHPTILGRWYRRSGKKAANRLLGALVVLPRTAVIFLAFSGLKYWEHPHGRGSGPRRVSLLRVAWRLFGGRNQTFLVCQPDWQPEEQRDPRV
jgi:FkbM family methyltransferase